MKNLRFLAIPALLSSVLSAQITYVDATHGSAGNTTLADGSTFTPAGNVGTDNQWANRPFANNGTIYSTNDVNATGAEDGPMLRTRITGLLPLFEYQVYAYFWGADGTHLWRGRCEVSNMQPVKEPPGYNTRHFSTSAFSPMSILADDAPVGTGTQVELKLQYDVNNNNVETSGHFANNVMIQEGNRWLYEVSLGIHRANSQGEIDVYVDDLANTVQSNRTWYDGVGYKMAPSTFGTDCGSPATPSMTFTGEATLGHTLNIKTSGGPASTPAMLILGLSSSTWSGNNLPLDLSFMGFSGCSLNVSFDLPIATATGPSGDAELPIPLPVAGNAVKTYWQWAVLAPSGLAVSQGLFTDITR